MYKSNSIKNLLAVLVFAAFSMSFVSCGDDEPEPHDNSKVPASVVADYKVIISDNFYKYFDVTVEYTTPGGQTEKLILTEDWMYNFNISDPVVADKYVCHVVANPKNPVPEVESGVTYNLDRNATAKVSILNSEGVSLDENNGSNITTETISAEAMAKYVTRSHTILNYSFEPKIDK